MHKPILSAVEVAAAWRSSATAGFTLCSIRSCRTAGIRTPGWLSDTISKAAGWV